MNSIKVELTNDGDFFGIRTYDRPHGAHGRFLISRRAMVITMFEPDQKITVDTDCGCFAEIWKSGHLLWVRITWLSIASSGQAWGFRQTVQIPEALLQSVLMEKNRQKYLCQPRQLPARILSIPASHTIRLILADKRKRRAFIKAMRDYFQWPDEVVTLYNDGSYSFYFVTESGFPKNGGLILHEGTRNGHHYYYYSVHT